MYPFIPFNLLKFGSRMIENVTISLTITIREIF